MRYIVEPRKLKETDTEPSYFILDLDKNLLSYSYYTTFSAASEMVQKKNKEIEVHA